MNAFFQQTAWSVWKKFEPLKSWSEISKIVPDANALYKLYLETFKNRTGHDVEEISPENKNKLKKRVYQLWNDLKHKFGG
jgi:hypothetical protein